MQFLKELLRQSEDEALLLEALGNLSDLKLGKMIDMLKQSFNAERKTQHHTTSEVGSRFNSYGHGLGPTSEIVDVGTLRSWNDVKKVYKKAAERGEGETNYGAQANVNLIAFYLEGKAVAVILSSDVASTAASNVCGIAWDFSKLTDLAVYKKIQLALEKPFEAFAGLSPQGRDVAVPSDPKRKRGITGSGVDPEKSEHTAAREIGSRPKNNGNRWDDWKVYGKATEYAGLTQSMRAVAAWTDALLKAVPVTAKIAKVDTKSIKKRGWGRSRPEPRILTSDMMHHMKQDLKKRLALYKNTKVVTIDDAKDLVEKLFSGDKSLKKITFKGITYHMIPEKRYLGSSDDRARRKTPGAPRYQTFYDQTFHALFKGEKVSITFKADDATGEYATLYLYVKLVKGVITPVEISYTDKSDGDRTKTEKFD